MHDQWHEHDTLISLCFLYFFCTPRTSDHWTLRTVLCFDRIHSVIVLLLNGFPFIYKTKSIFSEIRSRFKFSHEDSFKIKTSVRPFSLWKIQTLSSSYITISWHTFLSNSSSCLSVSRTLGNGFTSTLLWVLLFVVTLCFSTSFD